MSKKVRRKGSKPSGASVPTQTELPKPAVEQQLRFKDVRTHMSNGVVLYTFLMPGRDVVKHTSIKRVEDGGVQRKELKTQAMHILKAMERGDIFAQQLMLVIQGECVYNESTHELILDVSTDQNGVSRTVCLLDDGQQRRLALSMLLDKGRGDIVDRYTFTVSAMINPTRVEQVGVFTSQTRNARLDSSHVYSLESESDTFENDLLRRMHQLYVALNERDESPLKGRIVLSQRPLRAGMAVLHGEGKIHFSEIRTALKSIMAADSRSTTSGLRGLKYDDRIEIVVDFLRAFAEVFPAFHKPSVYLGTYEGILTALAVIYSNCKFHDRLAAMAYPDEEVRDRYSYDRMKQVLEMLVGMRWKTSSKNQRDLKGCIAMTLRVLDRALYPPPSASDE